MKTKKFVLLTVLVLSLFLVSTAVAQDGDTDENPWVFQNWCLNHLGCGDFGIRNKTDGWLQITMTYGPTGESEFFSFAPKSRHFVTMRPGSYYHNITAWRNGKMNNWDLYMVSLPGNQFWEYEFKCFGRSLAVRFIRR